MGADSKGMFEIILYGKLHPGDSLMNCELDCIDRAITVRLRADLFSIIFVIDNICLI